MAELSCDMKKCTYNRDNLCCKGDIMVGGRDAQHKDRTSCDSYTERREDSYMNATEHPKMTISIDCEAVKCKYNSNYRCSAEHVDIRRNGTGIGKETLCATFIEK